MRTLLLFLLLSPVAMAQQTAKTPPLHAYSMRMHLGFVAGWNQGHTYFPELGIGIGKLEDMHGYGLKAASASLEFHPNPNIYGIKLCGWINTPILPLSVGVATVSYFDNSNNFDQSLRPMIGIAYKYVHLTYGIDATLGRKTIDSRNLHVIGLRVFIPTFKLKEDEMNVYSYPAE